MPVLKEKFGVYCLSFVKKFLWRFRGFSCAISPKTKVCSAVKNKNRYLSASLTTEAALVFPVFFFGVYMLWQLFLLLLFQMSVCREMTGAAMKYAHLGYPERKAEEQEMDISWLYQPLFWNSLPNSDRAEGMWILCLPEEDGSIQVRVSYRFVCEAVLFSKWAFPIQQNFRFIPYFGETDPDLFTAEKEEKEDKEDVVYVTEYGTVYHESRACSYLNVVVRPVDADKVDEERNSSGKKYTLCKRCGDEKATETVYLSEGGTKYHLTAGCSVLKRTVTEQPREEVDLPACHKCGNRKEKQEEKNGSGRMGDAGSINRICDI